MTDRERWTIYPLLFLALGASIKDKMVRPDVLEIDHVQCRNLSILDAQGRRSVYAGAGGIQARDVKLVSRAEKRVLSLGSTPKNQPRIELYGETGGKVLVLGTDSTGNAGSIVSYDPTSEDYAALLGGSMHVSDVECRELRVVGGEGNDELRVIIASTESGNPRIEVYGSPGHRVLAMGSDDTGSAGSVVSFDAEGKPHFMITASLRPNAPQLEAPAQSPAADAEDAPTADSEDEPSASDDAGSDADESNSPGEQSNAADDA